MERFTTEDTESTQEGECDEGKTARLRRRPLQKQDGSVKLPLQRRLGAGVELERSPVERLLEDNVGILVVEKC